MYLEHANLTVTDIDRSIAFYRDLFGYEVRWRGKDSAGRPAAHVGDDRFYLAFFGRVPFYGTERSPTLDVVIDSGASLVVASPRSPVTVELARDGRFESLDSVAFPEDASSPVRPFHVYRVRREARALGDDT